MQPQVQLPESLDSIRRTNVFPSQRHRWNSNEEIASILISFENHEKWLSREVRTRPESGSLILYSRKQVRYRRDGYCWKKRKDGKTTREDHMKLKVQGVELIYGCYVHSAILCTFHRRCYWLLLHPEIVLVHYLNVSHCADSRAQLSFSGKALSIASRELDWGRDQLIRELKPMFHDDTDPEATKELDKCSLENIEQVVAKLMAKQRARCKFLADAEAANSEEDHSQNETNNDSNCLSSNNNFNNSNRKNLENMLSNNINIINCDNVNSESKTTSLTHLTNALSRGNKIYQSVVMNQHTESSISQENQLFKKVIRNNDNTSSTTLINMQLIHLDNGNINIAKNATNKSSKNNNSSNYNSADLNKVNEDVKKDESILNRTPSTLGTFFVNNLTQTTPITSNSTNTASTTPFFILNTSSLENTAFDNRNLNNNSILSISMDQQQFVKLLNTSSQNQIVNSNTKNNKQPFTAILYSTPTVSSNKINLPSLSTNNTTVCTPIKKSSLITNVPTLNNQKIQLASNTNICSNQNSLQNVMTSENNGIKKINTTRIKSINDNLKEDFQNCNKNYENGFLITNKNDKSINNNFQIDVNKKGNVENNYSFKKEKDENNEKSIISSVLNDFPNNAYKEKVMTIETLEDNSKKNLTNNQIYKTQHCNTKKTYINNENIVHSEMNVYNKNQEINFENHLSSIISDEDLFNQDQLSVDNGYGSFDDGRASSNMDCTSSKIEEDETNQLIKDENKMVFNNNEETFVSTDLDLSPNEDGLFNFEAFDMLNDFSSLDYDLNNNINLNNNFNNTSTLNNSTSYNNHNYYNYSLNLDLNIKTEDSPLSYSPSILCDSSRSNKSICKITENSANNNYNYANTKNFIYDIDTNNLNVNNNLINNESNDFTKNSSYKDDLNVYNKNVFDTFDKNESNTYNENEINTYDKNETYNKIESKELSIKSEFFDKTDILQPNSCVNTVHNNINNTNSLSYNNKILSQLLSNKCSFNLTNQFKNKTENQTFNLIDYSPRWFYSDLNEKNSSSWMYFIVEGLSLTNSYQVKFEDLATVHGILIASNVIRCHIPICNTEKTVNIEILENGKLILNKLSLEFKLQSSSSINLNLNSKKNLLYDVNERELKFCLLEKLQSLVLNFLGKAETIKISLNINEFENDLIKVLDKLSNIQSFKQDDLELKKFSNSFKNNDNEKFQDNKLNVDTLSILHLASALGFTNFIFNLLEWKDINSNSFFDYQLNLKGQDNCGSTPLMWSMAKGHEASSKLLISLCSEATTILNIMNQDVFKVAELQGYFNLANSAKQWLKNCLRTNASLRSDLGLNDHDNLIDNNHLCSSNYFSSSINQSNGVFDFSSSNSNNSISNSETYLNTLINYASKEICLDDFICDNNSLINCDNILFSEISNKDKNNFLPKEINYNVTKIFLSELKNCFNKGELRSLNQKNLINLKKKDLDYNYLPSYQNLKRIIELNLERFSVFNFFNQLNIEEQAQLEDKINKIESDQESIEKWSKSNNETQFDFKWSQLENELRPFLNIYRQFVAEQAVICIQQSFRKYLFLIKKIKDCSIFSSTACSSNKERKFEKNELLSCNLLSIDIDQSICPQINKHPFHPVDCDEMKKKRSASTANLSSIKALSAKRSLSTRSQTTKKFHQFQFRTTRTNRHAYTTSIRNIY